MLAPCFGATAAAVAAEGAEYAFIEEFSTAEIGQTLIYQIKDAEGKTLDSSLFNWTVTPAGDAVSKNGSVTVLAKGTYTVKAALKTDASKSLSTQVNVEDTPYTEDGSLNFNFTNALAMNRLQANFVPDDSGIDAGNEDWQNHWELNASQGYVQRINDFSAEVSNNVAHLYFKNKKMTYFEATMIYQNVTGGSGWIGFISNNTDLSKRGLDNGLASFVQTDGKPTLWGPLANGGAYEQSNPGYGTTAWHVLKVRITDKVEIFIDDMVTPFSDLKTSAGARPNLVGTPPEGYIGIMTSGTSYRIKHIRASYLDVNGDKIPYRAVETFALPESEKVTQATVGQTIALNPQIQPAEASIKSFTMTSSNSNICIAKKGKLIFIGEGDVTITVASDDDPALKEEWTISVAPNPEQPEPGSGSHPAEIQQGCNASNPVGMALTIAFSVLAAAGVGGILVLLRIKHRM